MRYGKASIFVRLLLSGEVGWALLGQWAGRYSNLGTVALPLRLVGDKKEILDILLRGQIILSI
jgi:hypothetical protein